MVPRLFCVPGLFFFLSEKQGKKGTKGAPPCRKKLRKRPLRALCGPGTVSYTHLVEAAFPYDGSLGEVAAFRAQVEYDPTVLEYLRPTYGESVQAGTVTTQNTPGKVASVYTAPAGGPYLAAEDAIVYRFRILESAVPGLATVFASAFELSTPEPAAIPEDVDVSLSFQVLEPPSSDARLLSLAPDHGQLQPAFDLSLIHI